MSMSEVSNWDLSETEISGKTHMKKTSKSPTHQATKPKAAQKPASKSPISSKSPTSASPKKPSPKKTSPKTPAAKEKSISDSTEANKSPAQSTVLVLSNLAKSETFLANKPFRIERILTANEVADEYLARKDELDKDFENASKVMKKFWKELKKSADYKSGHITGGSVRFRTKYGQVVSPLKVVLAINVARKLLPSEIAQTKIIELKNTYGGFEVKVLEGAFEFIQSSPKASFLRGLFAPSNPLSFSDEVVGGVPVCPPSSPEDYGTLGVVFSYASNKFTAITCQHVAVGLSRIDQRGPDVSGLPTLRPIGAVDTANTVLDEHSHDGVTETIDVSVIQLSPAGPHNPGLKYPTSPGAWIRGITQSLGTTTVVPLFFSSERATPDLRHHVIWKFGATTGTVLKGRFDNYFNLEYDVQGRKCINNFTVKHEQDNQIFVLPGDSGSLLALDAFVGGTRAFVAIGILFASIVGSSNIGLACNICTVLDRVKTVPKKRMVRLVDRASKKWEVIS